MAEIVGRVIRACGTGKIGRMARVTVRGCLTDIIPHLVTGGAGHRRMRSRQRERRRCMVKRRRCPGVDRVAGHAIVIKPIGHVIRLARLVRCEISRVA